MIVDAPRGVCLHRGLVVADVTRKSQTDKKQEWCLLSFFFFFCLFPRYGRLMEEIRSCVFVFVWTLLIYELRRLKLWQEMRERQKGGLTSGCLIAPCRPVRRGSSIVIIVIIYDYSGRGRKIVSTDDMGAAWRGLLQPVRWRHASSERCGPNLLGWFKIFLNSFSYLFLFEVVKSVK